MGVKHGLGIGCLALVIGIMMGGATEDDSLFFCWICALPLTLAGIGFFIPDKDKTVVVYPNEPPYQGDYDDELMSFEEMDTDGDGVISPEEYYQ